MKGVCPRVNMPAEKRARSSHCLYSWFSLQTVPSAGDVTTRCGKSALHIDAVRKRKNWHIGGQLDGRYITALIPHARLI